MVQPIQIILIGFLLFAISRVYLQIRQGSLGIGEYLFWGTVFSVATLGVIDPGFLNYAARQLGIGRGADVAIYFSITLLFYLIFRANVHLESLRHEITKLTREIALLEKAPPPRSKRPRSQ